MTFTNTAGVWNFLKPRLLGSWHRLEAVQPDGLPDLIGFYRGGVHMVEIKVGPDKLRTSQRLMIEDAALHGYFIWTAHAKGARITWHRGLMIAESPVLPDFLKR